MSRSERQRQGDAGEDRALAFLQARGLVMVARNACGPLGEIDLIMREGVSLVFVEVRLRRSQRYGGAAASVTPAKQAKLRRQALAWLKQHFGDRAWPACRFDVIALDGGQCNWIRDAF